MPTPPPVIDRLLELSSALTQLQARFAVIGGIAVAARGYPRATLDIDFLIHEQDIALLRRLMKERAAETLYEMEEFSCYGDHDVRADFQYARRPISQGMLTRSTAVKVRGQKVPFVSVEDLIGLKIQSYHNNPVRLRDLSDIQELLRANIGNLDLAVLRHYFRLFNREALLDELLAYAKTE